MSAPCAEHKGEERIAWRDCVRIGARGKRRPDRGNVEWMHEGTLKSALCGLFTFALPVGNLVLNRFERIPARGDSDVHDSGRQQIDPRPSHLASAAANAAHCARCDEAAVRRNRNEEQQHSERKGKGGAQLRECQHEERSQTRGSVRAT
ncbi:MAG: hypothetical protein ACI9DC_003658 [Gammaproteobacteria bacterium]|jgi:hypothetical protein